MRLCAPFATLAAFVSAALAQDVVTPPSISGSLTGLKYTSVGGSGSYNQVTNMIPGNFPTCDANPSCITAPKSVSGNLAPFDDEITFNFRGPMNLFNIAVYQPADSSGATWTQTSSWAAGQAPDNLVFMNNMGGGASGEWSICGGSSQSYASGDFTSAVATPNAEISNGVLDEDHEMNIMTAETCASRACPGFSRGTANHGWAGSKMLVTTFTMPPSSTPSKVPALWALNAQIVRAAQYGCNCRGVGSPGGCGELDILETLVGADPGPDAGVSEIYSFKGATGSGNDNFFARPTGERATYAVVFDERTDSVAIQRLVGWDYAQKEVGREVVDGYLGAPALQVDFSTGARRRGVRGGHRRAH